MIYLHALASLPLRILRSPDSGTAILISLARNFFVERQLGKNLYMEVAQENRPVLCSELPLKTKNSKRAVVLADFVLDEILLERQRYEKRKASDPEFLDLATSAVMKTGSAITVVFISSLTTA